MYHSVLPQKASTATREGASKQKCRPERASAGTGLALFRIQNCTAVSP